MAVFRGTTTQRSITNSTAHRYRIGAHLPLRHGRLLLLLVELLEIDLTTRAGRDRLDEERTGSAISKMTLFFTSMTTAIEKAIAGCHTSELLVGRVIDGARHLALRLTTAAHLLDQD